MFKTGLDIGCLHESITLLVPGWVGKFTSPGEGQNLPTGDFSKAETLDVTENLIRWALSIDNLEGGELLKQFTRGFAPLAQNSQPRTQILT